MRREQEFYRKIIYQELKELVRQMDFSPTPIEHLIQNTHILLEQWQGDNDEMFDTCWYIGSKYLQDNPEDLTKFLLKMSGLKPKLPESLLLELTLNYMKLKMYDEALERLMTYIPLHPYIEDPLLVGYAGMIAYILWKEKDNQRYYKLGVEYLKKSCSLDSSNSLFITLYFEMMTTGSLDDIEELETWLVEKLDQSDVYVKRHQYDLYRYHYPQKSIS